MSILAFAAVSFASFNPPGRFRAREREQRSTTVRPPSMEPEEPMKTPSPGASKGNRRDAPMRCARADRSRPGG